MCRRKLIKASLALVLLAHTHTVCFAETIYLKNGTKLEGRVLEKTDKKIKVDANGVTLNYDIEEVKSIDGLVPLRPLTQAAPQMLLPAANQPQAVVKIPSSPLTPQASQNLTQGVPASLLPSTVSPSKQDLILNLIEADGTREGIRQVFLRILDQAPAQDVDELRTIFDIDEVAKLLIGVYDRYFTEEELRELVTFYQSALGRKLRMITPYLMEDSTKVSSEYFERKLQELEGSHKTDGQ